MPNKLMFEVGVKEVDKKISDLRKEFDDFEAKYGKNGIKVSLDLKGAIGDVQALIDALKLVGDVSKLKKYEEEIAKLKKKIDDLQKTASGTGSSTAAGVDQTKKSVNTATERIQYLLNILKDVKNQSIKFGDANFDVTRLDNIFNKLMKIKQELIEIQNSGGLHPVSGKTANQLMSEQNISGIERNLRMELSYYKQIETEFEKIEKLKAGLQNVLGGITDPAKQQEIRQTITNLENLQGLITRMGTNDARFVFGGKDYKDNMANANVLLKESVTNLKAQQKAANDEQKSVNQAAIQWEKLGVKIRDLQALRDKGLKLGLDPTEINNYIKEIARLRSELYSIMNGANNGKSLGKFFEGGLYTNQLMAHADVQRPFILGKEAATKFGTEVKTAAASVNQLSLEEQKLAQAINKGSHEMNQQSQVLSDLKMMAYQYLSVWGAQSFLNNIIEIGGQLEMQRMSIGAILGDTAHANDLFDKIKAQALQSPFGVVELDQMSKQLSAYGFQYSELFDMTKRLADISAATGTSVDRLALALGHVRNEAALSGYTLRQFSMANIPLAKKLSEHLTEVEKRFVSVAEVRKRVSKKEIGYEDVEKVLKDLTNEGGMFYNMQETIAQSIKARFKNLKDAFSIMYGDLAESGVGDFMKDIAKVLTEMTTHWQEFFAILRNVGIAFGVYKASVLAMNVALGANNKAVISNILAYKQKRAAELQNEALVRKLTAEELKLITTRKEITAANLQVAMSTNAITKGEALNLVALRKVSLAEAAAAVNMGLFSEAEVMAARNTNVLVLRLKLLGQSLWGVTKSLLLSPQMWIFALIAGVTELWQMNKKEIERAKEMNDDLFNRANEGIKNTRTMLQETEVKYMVNGVDATEQFGDLNGGKFMKQAFNSIDTATAMSIMDKWERYIKEYAAMPNHLLNEAYKEIVKDGDKEVERVRTLSEQYEELYKKVMAVADAQRYLKDTSEAIEYAENKTNTSLFGLFDDTLTTNINDYAKAIRGFNDSVSDLIRKHRKVVATVLQSARADKTFVNGLKEAKIATTDYAGQLKELVLNQDKYADAYKKVQEVVGKMTGDDYKAGRQIIFGNVFTNTVHDWYVKQKEALNTMEKDIDIWVDAMKQKMAEAWGTSEIKDLTEAQKEAVVQAIAEEVSKASQGTDAIRNEVKRLMQEKFGIKIDDNTADVAARIAGLKKSLMDLTKHTDWHITVGTDFESSYGNIKKAYKAAKTYLESTKPLQMKLNIDVTGGMKELGQMKRTQMVNQWRAKNPGKDSTWLEEYLADFDSHAIKMQEALDFSKTTGLSLEDKKDKKGSGEDKEAKKLREIAKLYKDAYDWYKKYAKQIGESAGLEKVKGQFQPLFDEFNKEWKTSLTLDSIPKYRENLEGLLETAQKMYKTKEHRNNYMVDAIKTIRDAISDVDYNEAQRKMDEYASRVQTDLDAMTRAWDTFNSVREATGNIDLAEQLSGAEYKNGKNRNLADAIRQKIQEDFVSSNVVSIPFNITFDDEQIEKKVMDAFNESAPQRNEGESEKEYAARLTKYQEKIKGIIDAYKKWRDLQRDVTKSNIQTFAKIVGSAKDYGSQLKLINDELEKQKDANQQLVEQGVISQKQADEANELAVFEARDKAWKASLAYSQLFNNSLALTRQEIENGINFAMDMLNEKMQRGLMTAQEYADEVAKIRNIQSEWNKNAALVGGDSRFWAGAKGGIQGVRAYNQRNLNRINSDIATLERQAKSGQSYDGERLYNLRNRKTDIENYEEKLDNLEGVLDKFDALSKALDPVINLFDQLGMTGVGEVLGIGQSALSQAASMGAGAEALFAGAGPYGAAIGAGISVIGSLMSLSDKAHEKRIQELKQEVTKIDKTLNTIKALRERELGYDTGTLRSQMKEMYNGQQSFRKLDLGGGLVVNIPGSAVEGMKEYYGRFSGGNGYSQEYNALIETRKKYMEMYDEENAKKKESQEALEEYKAKIAELDEQIMFFTEDLAKELWNIDIQGWAEQIGDALWTAFENGEDAAEAFGDTARDIISNVAKDMWQLSILKPLFNELQETLFGQFKNGRYTGGTIKYDSNGNIDMQASEQPTLEALGKYFGENGIYKQAVEGGKQFYDWVQEITGIDLSKDESSSTSSSIKGITEQTADLLASYVNGIRSDVSVIRNLQGQYLPMYYDVMTRGSSSLTNIENHTAAIMRSNDSIKQSVEDLYRDFHGLRTSAWKMPIA